MAAGRRSPTLRDVCVLLGTVKRVTGGGTKTANHGLTFETERYLDYSSGSKIIRVITKALRCRKGRQKSQCQSQNRDTGMEAEPERWQPGRNSLELLALRMEEGP